MRCNTPGIRQLSSDREPRPFSANPIANRIALRRTVCSTRVRLEKPRASLDWNDRTSDTPTIKRKNGNTRSVGVQPFQLAWRSGQ